jgi:hypothetical protein
MRALSARRVLRGLLLFAALGGTGALVAVALSGRAETPRREPSEGWRVRGFHKTRYEGGVPVLSVVADEARVERPRFGPFRIGFARRLVLRGARIDVLAAPAVAPRSIATRKRRRPSPASSAVTELRVDRLALRVRQPAGDAIEIRAGRCEANLLGGGEITCRGGVRVRRGRTVRRVPELRYQLRTRRFIGTNGIEELNLAAATALPYLRGVLSVL